MTSADANSIGFIVSLLLLTCCCCQLDLRVHTTCGEFRVKSTGALREDLSPEQVGAACKALILFATLPPAVLLREVLPQICCTFGNKCLQELQFCFMKENTR